MTREAARLDLEILGRSFAIVSNDSRLIDLNEELWAPFVAAPRADTAHIFRIGWDGTEWDLQLGRDEPPIQSSDPWVIANQLRYALASRAAEETEGLVGVHAACLAREDRALLLVGGGGAGKTTLTLALLATGWSMLSDDLAPLEISTLRVLPFPKPLGIKDPRRWSEFRHLWRRADWPPPPIDLFLIPSAGLLGSVQRPVAPSEIVFPRFRSGVELSVERLSTGETIAHLAENAFPLRADTLPPLVALARAATGARLVYGVTSDAVKALERAVASIQITP